MVSDNGSSDVLSPEELIMEASFHSIAHQERCGGSMIEKKLAASANPKAGCSIHHRQQRADSSSTVRDRVCLEKTTAVDRDVNSAVQSPALNRGITLPSLEPGAFHIAPGFRGRDRVDAYRTDDEDNGDGDACSLTTLEGETKNYLAEATLVTDENVGQCKVIKGKVIVLNKHGSRRKCLAWILGSYAICGIVLVSIAIVVTLLLVGDRANTKKKNDAEAQFLMGRLIEYDRITQHVAVLGFSDHQDLCDLHNFTGSGGIDSHITLRCGASGDQDEGEAITAPKQKSQINEIESSENTFCERTERNELKCYLEDTERAYVRFFCGTFESVYDGTDEKETARMELAKTNGFCGVDSSAQDLSPIAFHATLVRVCRGEPGLTTKPFCDGESEVQIRNDITYCEQIQPVASCAGSADCHSVKFSSFGAKDRINTDRCQMGIWAENDPLLLVSLNSLLAEFDDLM